MRESRAVGDRRSGRAGHHPCLSGRDAHARLLAARLTHSWSDRTNRIRRCLFVGGAWRISLDALRLGTTTDCAALGSGTPVAARG